MSEVWVLETFGTFDEGTEVAGVYSTREKCRAAIDALGQMEYTVDTDYEMSAGPPARVVGTFAQATRMKVDE